MNLQSQSQTLIFGPKLVFSEEVENEHNDFNSEKEYAVQTITFFSKSKDEDKIREYVNSKHIKIEDRDSFFILNREVSVIELIK